MATWTHMATHRLCHVARISPIHRRFAFCKFFISRGADSSASTLRRVLQTDLSMQNAD